MKTSATCPACQGTMSLWDCCKDFRTWSLIHFRCPRCKAKLRVKMRGLWFLIALTVMLLIGWILVCRPVARAFPSYWVGFLLYVACLAIGGFVITLSLTTIYYTYAELTVESNPRKV